MKNDVIRVGVKISHLKKIKSQFLKNLCVTEFFYYFSRNQHMKYYRKYYSVS